MSDHTHRLTHAVRRQDYPNCRPRDAATLIIVDTKGKAPRVLMGRRHEGHTFLPGKFVFPGGRVDHCDSRLATDDDLHPVVGDKLLVDMKGRASPTRARAMALTALRETFEETGLLIGRKAGSAGATRSPAWRNFLAHGVAPALAPLNFIARAITPPRRPRRYDTRFFCVDAEHIAAETHPQDAELLDHHWLTLPEALALDLPVITQVILEDLRDQLDAAGGLPGPDHEVPYYYMRHGRFFREVI